MPLVPALGDPIPNAASPTAGQGLVLDELGRVPAATVRLLMLTADPASPLDGDVWYRTDTQQLSVRVAGVTKRVTLA